MQAPLPWQKLNCNVTFQISHYIYIYYYNQIVPSIIILGELYLVFDP